MININNRNFANYLQNIQKNKQNLLFGTSSKLLKFGDAVRREAILSSFVLITTDAFQETNLKGYALSRILVEGLSILIAKIGGNLHKKIIEKGIVESAVKKLEGMNHPTFQMPVILPEYKNTLDRVVDYLPTNITARALRGLGRTAGSVGKLFSSSKSV